MHRAKVWVQIQAISKILWPLFMQNALVQGHWASHRTILTAGWASHSSTICSVLQMCYTSCLWLLMSCQYCSNELCQPANTESRLAGTGKVAQGQGGGNGGGLGPGGAGLIRPGPLHILITHLTRSKKPHKVGALFGVRRIYSCSKETSRCLLTCTRCRAGWAA